MNKNLEKSKKRESEETPHKTISSSLITTKNRTRGNLSQDFANLGERLKTIQEHCGNQSFRGDISHNLDKEKNIYTSNFALQGTDRFGGSIFTQRKNLKALDPGRYGPKRPSKIKGGLIGTNRKRLINDTVKEVPGPCYYSAKKSQARISFLFNRDQKWIQ